MATGDLITTDQATAGLPASATAAQLALVPTLITAASKAVVKYLQRPVLTASYDQVTTPQSGQWDRGEADQLMVRWFPVRGVSRVAGGRTTALTITNTDTGTNSRATVTPTFTGDAAIQTTLTGLQLDRVASGTASSSPLLFADYPTISALTAAVNALGNGWSASVADSTFNNWASADLWATLGPQGCLVGSSTGTNGASFDLFPTDLALYSADLETGILWISPSTPVGGRGPGAWWQWPNSSADAPSAGSWRGQVRVSYTAGWDATPEDIAQAVTMVVQSMFYDLTLASAYKSETIGRYSYTLNETDASIPDAARILLKPYRSYRR